MASLKTKLSTFVSTLLSLPLVFAARNSAFEPMVDIFQNIFYIGSFEWLDTAYRGYAVKFIYLIALIVVIDWSLQKVITDKKPRGIISFAISAISIMFLPNNLAETAGSVYGKVIALLLLSFVPIAAIIGLYFASNKISHPRLKFATKCVLSIIGIMTLGTIAAYIQIRGGA